MNGCRHPVEPNVAVGWYRFADLLLCVAESRRERPAKGDTLAGHGRGQTWGVHTNAPAVGADRLGPLGPQRQHDRARTRCHELRGKVQVREFETATVFHQGSLNEGRTVIRRLPGQAGKEDALGREWATRGAGYEHERNAGQRHSDEARTTTDDRSDPHKAIVVP
jgi:hypothetical protein